jgi:hypothetical protein
MPRVLLHAFRCVAAGLVFNTLKRQTVDSASLVPIWTRQISLKSRTLTVRRKVLRFDGNMVIEFMANPTVLKPKVTCE